MPTTQAHKNNFKKESTQITITPPNTKIIKAKVVGTSPLVMNRFSQKAKQQIQETQEGGSTSKSTKKQRDPKNFEELYEAAKHLSKEGWPGIPATAFRNSMVRACSLVNIPMTLAKMAIFIVSDGDDREEGTPLVKITGGSACYNWIAPCRNASGVIDLRPRPRWDEWACTVTIRYDADIFTAASVVNLLARSGEQVGVLEGRPASKNSCGLGFGCWALVSSVEPKKASGKLAA